MTNKNLGNNVSRVLSAKDRNFDSVVWQKKRPPLDSEHILTQEISSERTANILRKTTPSGFLHIVSMDGAPEDRNLLTAAWSNSFKFKSPTAIVNGWMINVGIGTNQYQENAQENIWKQISNDEEEIAVVGTQAPLIAHREDLVFMEVWLKLIDASDIVYINGNTQSAVEPFENDLIDEDIEIETTKRVQIQYRFRWVDGVDFDSFRDGLGYPGAYARGGLDTPNTSYYFQPHPRDPGLYWAGNGDLQSQTDLNTVDGYVYAIPIARIHRKNRSAYTLTNQNGSAISLTSGTDSDRPDKQYYDEISRRDIDDLRHQISLTNFEYDRMLEEGLHQLWSRNLSGLKRSALDENLVGDKNIQIDGISVVSRTGIDDVGRDPDGVKRAFSDGKEYQKVAFYIDSPSLVGGKIWFKPFGLDPFNNPFAYELFDEEKYYLRPISAEYEPLIIEYNTSTYARNVIGGGTWENLGEYRHSDYLPSSGIQNRASFQPLSTAQVENKKIMILFDFVVREGGGISETVGGFNYKMDRILVARNEKDSRPVEFNHYKSNSKVIELEDARLVGTYLDTGLTRSISSFEAAAESTTDQTYKAAATEIIYRKLSTGSANDTIPNEVYGREVFGILSVYNVTASLYLTPNVTKTSGGFDLDGLTVDTGDMLEYTLLLGTYTVDYVPQTRGLRNIAKTFVFTTSVTHATEGIINVKNIIGNCDAVLANTGFFNGSVFRYTAYVSGERVFLSSLVGLGTPIIKYTLANPAVIGSQIDIHLLGYFSPDATDKLYFQYEYTPYKGILQERLDTGDTQRVKILKMDDKLTAITAGSGSENQMVPEEYQDMAGMLPINKVIKESNLFGANIETYISGGNSALRRIPGRGLSYKEENTFLKEGMILTLKADEEEKEMLRGVIISDPHISERGFDLKVPDVRDDGGNLNTNPDTGLPYDLIFETDMSLYNHMSQWSAIVEGLDSLKGELFLMVVTTISTVYNSDEGAEYEYLENKDLFEENALGKGIETKLDNNITDTQLTQNLGFKVIGAVDLFPLRNRPLILPTSS